MGLFYLYTICWVLFFFRLGLLYHLLFRIDVGLFCGLTLLHFFFKDFSSKKIFGLFFCLKVEQIIFFFI